MVGHAHWLTLALLESGCLSVGHLLVGGQETRCLACTRVFNQLDASFYNSPSPVCIFKDVISSLHVEQTDPAQVWNVACNALLVPV